MTPSMIKSVREQCEQAITEADAEEEADRTDPYELCPRSGTPAPSFVTAETVLALIEEIDLKAEEARRARAEMRALRHFAGKRAEEFDHAQLVNGMHRRAQQAEAELTARGEAARAVLKQIASDALAELGRVRTHNAALIRMARRGGTIVHTFGGEQ